MADGVSIIGGYNSEWVQQDLATVVNVINTTAVTARNINQETLLHNMDFQAANGTPEESSYGLFARDADGLVVRNSMFQAGMGGHGVDGLPGSLSGSAGGNGGNGQNGRENERWRRPRWWRQRRLCRTRLKRRRHRRNRFARYARWRRRISGERWR
jgi:hypothetical protein